MIKEEREGGLSPPQLTPYDMIKGEREGGLSPPHFKPLPTPAISSPPHFTGIFMCFYFIFRNTNNNNV